MRSPNVSRSEADEDQPARPSPWWSFSLLMTVAGVGVGGGFLGVIVGGFAADSFNFPPLMVVGLAVGAAAGLGLGYLHARKVIGQGKRTSDEPLPALKPGVGLRTHILALRDGLAMAPPKRVKSIEAHTGRVVSVAISPDGKSLLTGGGDHAVTLWDLASGFEVGELGALSGGVTAVAFSPDGRLAAACGLDGPGRGSYPGLARVWDVESRRELRRFEAEGRLLSLAFSPDGGALLLGGEAYLRVWDLESAELLLLLNIRSSLVENDMVVSVAVSPDGRYALCGCRHSEDARLIDLERGDCERRFTGHQAWFRLFKTGAILGVAFSPDGRRVLSGSLDQSARVWDVQSGKQLACFRGHVGRWGWRGVVEVAFLPDGKRAMSASKDGTVRLWDAGTGKELMQYEHGARVGCLAVSRDGRLAVSGGRDGFVRVWELPAT